MDSVKFKKKTDLLGVTVSIINVSEIIEVICQFAKSVHRSSLINYVNVHGYYLSFFDPEYKSVLNNSDIVFCDGFGVKIGAWLLKKPMGQRMCPPDWLDPLFEKCIQEDISAFFLGDEDHTIQLFTQKIKNKFPLLKVKGTHHGFFNKKNQESTDVIEKINNSGADLVLVGMGMPVQEKWAFANKDKINTKVILAVGGTFRWYAGVEKRAPRIVTDNGFEWLWRLFLQPRKVWKRYLVELPYFFWVVMKTVFSKKKK